MIGELLPLLAKLPPEAYAALVALEQAAVQAIADWLDGDDSHPAPTGALERLPDVLQSELALARAEKRAKAAGG